MSYGKCCCCGVDVFSLPPTYRFVDRDDIDLMACSIPCLSAYKNFTLRKNQMAELWEKFKKGDPEVVAKVNQ